MKIVAGIDFGTSMSMIQTLDHASAQPDALACRTVRFTQSAQAATPTLVRLDPESGAEFFGEEAQNAYEGELYGNFKLNLWSDDEEKQKQAKELAERFFRYLYTCYQDEKNKLYPGAKDAEEETVVGHPVQWSEKEREVILNAARKAGFRNVRGKDEASASVLCVMTHNQEALRKDNDLTAGKPVTIMVLDMGAGTTDLAFVRVQDQNGSLEIETLGTWPPKDYPEVFGGSRIDAVLAERMKNWLVQCGAQEETAGQMIESSGLSLKKWKEYTVSAELDKDAAVDGCSALNIMFYAPNMKRLPFPAFDRAGFEAMMAGELERFVRTVCSAPEELRIQTDLVFLTGGNSQWYWVEDILTGRNTAFGDAGLPKIKGKPAAIQKTTYPTETVSRGLVYRGQDIRFAQLKKITNKPLEEEDVFAEWTRKRAQCAYPDMKMMDRLCIDNAVSLAVTDSGRVLSTTPGLLNRIEDHNYSALRNIEAILSADSFVTKDGRLVEHTGREIMHSMMGRTYKGAWLDADGRLMVKLNTRHPDSLLLGGEEMQETLQRLEQEGQNTNVMWKPDCWDKPLQCVKYFEIPVGGTKKKAAIGLTRKGTLTTRRPEILEALGTMFLPLQLNPDNTLGEGIVDFYYRDGKLVILQKSGTLRVYKKGEMGCRTLAALHIAHIAFVNGIASEIWAIDDFGNLRKWVSYEVNPKDQIMMTDCVACAAYEGLDLMAMDSRGKVRYVTHFMTSGKRRREVEMWKIHDQ